MNLTINNYPICINNRKMNNKTAFKGEFAHSEALELAMERANDHDLHKFATVLGRMNSVNDNKQFALGYKDVYMPRPEEYKRTVYLSSDGKETELGSEINVHVEKSKNNCFNNIIKKVIGELENDYPDPQHNNQDRETSIQMISNQLTGEVDNYRCY